MAKKAKNAAADKLDAANDDLCRWFAHGGLKSSFLCIALFALLVREAVSLHSYSGAGDPPKYGDYEAQRHWMEITLNLPLRDWYGNTTENDLTYWGLDYPPLTAYQSYVHGLFLRYFDPDSVSLFTSRGYESYLGKLLMRWTVLSSDALIFFPAALCFVLVYYGNRSRLRGDAAWHIAVILINPCLILIDHGHFQVGKTSLLFPSAYAPRDQLVILYVVFFQYNCISLGLTLGAVAAVLSKRNLVASVLFCLSLNHKQMSAYYAPAFFSHLLGNCLRQKNPVLEILKLGLVVVGTFSIVWWPYLQSKDAILEVLLRLAPFERGIYEDYVANFWCATSVLIKWKKLFTMQSLKTVSLAATISTCIPSMVQQILSPSSKGFLYGLLNSSFAFYLFSFQVHEKSILLPLLPASLLAMELCGPFEMLMHYALFSMFPLLCRDRLVFPYIALYALAFLIYFAPGRRRDSKIPRSAVTRIILTFLYLCSIILHIIYLTIHPPEKYPYLFEAMIMCLCFSSFALFVIYTNSKQWMLSKQFTPRDEEKKSN